MKAALHRKHPELVNREHITFHQNNARPRVSLMTRQKLLQLGWEVLIHSLYLQDTATSILLMEKILIPWKTVNSTWNSSLLKKKN